ncbi:btb/poz-like protein [Schizothecium vesticola]|uniref:Btb/poz-like protein n=1 Tax=Schizothecium vesticola TaxID=314040 RepID=A0AA40K5W8_9PEZI|nr:btb/poz-like protein [Schizothecium vesticola]
MSDQDIPAVVDNDPFEKICDDPDVILVVGPNKVPIGVDTRCLRRGSKVFNAMFKPPWMESTRLSNDPDSPTDLALPEDDAQAMHHVCCIIHHRNDLVPAVFSASDILQIAVVVDKYDMLTALKYAAGGWLETRPEAETPEAEAILSMGNLLAAAYLFRDPKQFRSIAFQLMFGYSGTYRELRRTLSLSAFLAPRSPGKPR